MRRITREQITYRFAPDVAPVAEIEPGETVLLETLDAASGRLQRAEDIVRFTRERDPNRVNPATGPLAGKGRVSTDAGLEAMAEALGVDLDDLGASTTGTFVNRPADFATAAAAYDAAVRTTLNVNQAQTDAWHEEVAPE